MRQAILWAGSASLGRDRDTVLLSWSLMPTHGGEHMHMKANQYPLSL